MHMCRPFCMQGSKVLLVGESRSSFTVLRVIAAAGLRGVQFDRPGTLLRAALQASGAREGAAASAAEWREAAQAALATGSCVLASHKHLQQHCFPYQSFDHLIEYTAPPVDPGALEPANAAATADGEFAAAEAAGGGAALGRAGQPGTRGSVLEHFRGKHQQLVVTQGEVERCLRLAPAVQLPAATALPGQPAIMRLDAQQASVQADRMPLQHQQHLDAHASEQAMHAQTSQRAPAAARARSRSAAGEPAPFRKTSSSSQLPAASKAAGASARHGSSRGTVWVSARTASTGQIVC